MQKVAASEPAKIWVLAKDQNLKISCVEICFIFLANIENFMNQADPAPEKVNISLVL